MTDNPYKRLRSLTSTSQKDFAAKYSLSKTAMTYIESGQVVNLSDNMIVALGQECHENGVNAKQVLSDEYMAQDLQTAYQNWKSNERANNASLFQVPLSGNESFAASPFASYIQDVASSQQNFCKLLKVPAAAVMRYASGATLTMPKIIEEALTQVRFPYIEELKSIQTGWIGRSA